jgi:glycosyltransferase involved in cell wall biosynthesis
MRIAMIGIRGVPAQYGGLETCAEEVGKRLVQRGHEVIVYCRPGYWDDGAPEYEGIKRIVLSSLKTKITDTYSHSFLCMIHVLRMKPDVILAFNPSIASLCLIPKAFGYTVALNPDGFDWRREKWGPLARTFIYASAWLCTKVIDQMIIDAVSVCDYFNETFHCRPPAIYIPNGATPEPPEKSDVSPEDQAAILQRYGVQKDKYLLFLSRHVPENSCEYLLEAFKSTDTDMKLLFGGTGDSAYAKSLTATQDPRILFPGGIYDPVHVKVLHHNCYFVLHGNQPGGTSLGLLKALGYGACVMTLDTPDNAYAIQDAGLKYQLSAADIRQKMQQLLENPPLVSAYRAKAVRRIEEEYLWDVVTDKYEDTLRRIARSRAG